MSDISEGSDDPLLDAQRAIHEGERTDTSFTNIEERSTGGVKTVSSDMRQAVSATGVFASIYDPDVYVY